MMHFQNIFYKVSKVLLPEINVKLFNAKQSETFFFSGKFS